jgi:hypothetical protein
MIPAGTYVNAWLRLTHTIALERTETLRMAKAEPLARTRQAQMLVRVAPG